MTRSSIQRVGGNRTSSCLTVSWQDPNGSQNHVSAKVSIVVVNLDRAALTLDCIDSIIAHTDRGLYEIIVVDNGSAPLEINQLVEASHQFKLIPLERNMFFGEPSNIGAEQGSGDYIVFLNNDVKLTAGWLDTMLAVLECQLPGPVGPKIVASCDLLEARCVIRPDGWVIQIGKPHEASAVVHRCDADCRLLLGRMPADATVGVSRPRRLRSDVRAGLFRGRRPCDSAAVGRALFTYYCGGATVLHQESSTSSRIWSAEERQHHIATNHGRLVGRWVVTCRSALRKTLSRRRSRRSAGNRRSRQRGSLPSSSIHRPR